MVVEVNLRNEQKQISEKNKRVAFLAGELKIGGATPEELSKKESDLQEMKANYESEVSRLKA